MYYEDVFFTDAKIFQVFSFPLLIGNSKTVLNDPSSIIISERIREKYFNKENPIGKTISLTNFGDFKITGVFENIPQNSHFRFDFLISFLSLDHKKIRDWGIKNYYTYILVSNSFNKKEFNKKLPEFILKYLGEDSLVKHKTSFLLQPLKKIHLYSNFKGEIEPNSNIGIIYLFSLIAFIILIIACFNYINLSTARNYNRLKEIGIRKGIEEHMRVEVI